MAPKRNSYSFETKNEVILKVKAGAKRSAVQKEYGISSGTLCKWLNESMKIAAKVQDGQGKIKKSVPTPFPLVDSAMKVWFTEKRNNDVAIDSRVFKVQAMKFAKELGEDKFNGSVGFVSRWKNRYNVVHRAISGDANSVDLDTVEAFKPIILDLLEEYLNKDVFNLDEAGLQYGVTAKKTLAFKGEACHGKKQPKQRVTISFCANMPGTEKKRLLVIGKSLNPRCMPKNVRRPCNYQANQKAWMTSAIFEKWVSDWDRKLVKDKRRIALVLDNATCHPPVALSNIKLVFLPPNTTSHTQPMDQGIIANFKRHYRYVE